MSNIKTNKKVMDKSPLKPGDNKKTIVQEIVGKISGADSVLVTLPQNPSVDDLAAAIGLTMAIDKMGKRATAIYSGETPNALDFLRPEETFDKDAVGLQDFVIAINKDKADHLRYKLDGDYVKVFITPYKTSISEKDLEFSYGDFNVDLVVTLNVADEKNLDSALMEYGRILHNATIVNISLSGETKYGDAVWSDEGASSVCEMVTALLNEFGDKVDIDQDIATALLTGIVARTDRFSNAMTTPMAMTCAAKLMSAGADQQLISANMMEMMASNANKNAPIEEPVVEEQPQIAMPVDPSVMDIKHEEEPAEQKVAEEEAKAKVVVQPPVQKPVEQPAEAKPVADNQTIIQNVEQQKPAEMPEYSVTGLPTVEDTNSTIESIIAKANQESAANEEKTSPEVASIINSVANNMAGKPSIGINDINIDQVIEKSVADNILKKDAAAPVQKPAIPTGKDGEFMGGNPALIATPGVNSAPVPDVPMMNFDNAVTERKEKVLPEESYLKAPDAKLEKPKAKEQSHVVIQPTGEGLPQATLVNEVGTESGILPPPVNRMRNGVLPLPDDPNAIKIPTPPPLSL